MRSSRSREARAYEMLVDKYLASPHYGERWARHWLDVVRFAESDGFEMNQPRPNAWPYRDYVIRALNEDRPYDRFVAEQLAGDALGVDEATGFLVGGPVDRVKSPDITLTLQQRADELNDILSTTSSAFLGLTVGCARCHNHKFDPISQVDYYAMKAVFAGVQHGDRPLRVKDTEELRRRLAAIDIELSQHEPLARLGSTLLLDVNAAAQLVPRGGVEAYQAGTGRGQHDDPGDVDRLPTLGRGYSYWSKAAGRDVLAWEPKVRGRYRIWLSWGSGHKAHATDARYLLDNTEIVRVDQRRFADGTGDVPNQSAWSGFLDAGIHELTVQSRIVLRGGGSDDAVTADVLVLQAVPAEEKGKAAQPWLRAAVNRLKNVERFAPVEAKYVRMSILETTQLEPCIDELEVFTAGAKPRNVAWQAPARRRRRRARCRAMRSTSWSTSTTVATATAGAGSPTSAARAGCSWNSRTWSVSTASSGAGTARRTAATTIGRRRSTSSRWQPSRASGARWRRPTIACRRATRSHYRRWSD